jgi:hypothetical protein
MSAPHLEEAEGRMRELVADAGLPEPDEVEYGEASIFLYWHEQKAVIQVAAIAVTPREPATPPGPAEASPPPGEGAPSRDA